MSNFDQFLTEQACYGVFTAEGMHILVAYNVMLFEGAR
ncbi:hypothetical protein DFP78_11393 [Photobacterium lutimaris]|nr:hypothetical protein DFP78_11393 [Photobacterium lutimaris]